MLALVSIETTPNPNSMKLNLSERLGINGTFTKTQQADIPEVLQQLLSIEGIHSIFVADDFLTLNRDPRADWQALLTVAKNVFSGNQEENPSSIEEQRKQAEHQGQIQVLVQTFRNIPIQVKVTDGVTEERVGLPEHFGTTARELQTKLGADYLKERYWADWGIRYGTLSEVAYEVAEEVVTLVSETVLNQYKQAALGGLSEKNVTEKEQAVIQIDFNHPDWHERLRMVQQLEATEETLSLLLQALHDDQAQVRRWTAAKLAGVKTSDSVHALSERLLNDPNVGVRRTAGDSLSDIGDVAAQEAICQALRDNNKLVRWRAARFLAEVGTEAALPFLEEAKLDPEYEVRLEIAAAIQHIEQGSKAALPVWKLMSQELQSKP